MAKPHDHKQSVTVPIFGQSYTVRSDDALGVQRAAAAVDQRMQEVAQRTRTISPARNTIRPDSADPASLPRCTSTLPLF